MVPNFLLPCLISFQSGPCQSNHPSSISTGINQISQELSFLYQVSTSNPNFLSKQLTLPTHESTSSPHWQSSSLQMRPGPEHTLTESLRRSLRFAFGGRGSHTHPSLSQIKGHGWWKFSLRFDFGGRGSHTQPFLLQISGHGWGNSSLRFSFTKEGLDPGEHSALGVARAALQTQVWSLQIGWHG